MEREDVRKRYIAKSQAEIASLSERGLQMSGNAFSSLLILKGELGPGDQGGRTLLAGSDGKALAAAMGGVSFDNSAETSTKKNAPAVQNASNDAKDISGLDYIRIPDTLTCPDTQTRATAASSTPSLTSLYATATS